jgi:hypothetical protein
MSAATQLYYRQRQEIDTRKWNDCIDKASNGLIYAYSFYLDHMADNWDALVLNDYEAVMPLPWRKKFGIHYLYQPFLTPQLGLLGNNITKDLLEEFLASIPKKFAFWEINLNKGNAFEIPKFPLGKKFNYIISLDQPYNAISHEYHQNLKRNVKKAMAAGCVYKEDISLDEIFDPAIKQFHKHSNFSDRDALKFKTLARKLLLQKKAKTIGVYLNDVLCAACVFLIDHKAAYYILATTTSQGKKTGASHFLLDQFIKRNAGKALALDFAGSDVPSVGLFNKGFGAETYFYSSLRINRLHPLIKWIKN